MQTANSAVLHSADPNGARSAVFLDALAADEDAGVARPLPFAGPFGRLAVGTSPGAGEESEQTGTRMTIRKGLEGGAVYCGSLAF